MASREEILVVLVTNKWFDRGEVIYATRHGRDYETTRASHKCDRGYFIGEDKVERTNKEENPEYYL